MTSSPKLVVPFKADQFANEVVVVTGSGRGIGQAVAVLLAKYGARLVLAEIDSSGQATKDQILSTGGQAEFVQTDVAEPESVAQLARRTSERFGTATILINNAALSPAVRVTDMTVELWDRVMAVNLRGTFLACRRFLPAMAAAGGGAIVNMISTEAMPMMSAYMASKQGILAFSQSLAGEVEQQGIRVVAFAPGFVDTPGLRRAAEELSPAMGLSPEAFLGLLFHPAYAGAMPTEDAALATALLLANYMGDYHGDQVNGYTILEREGLIATAASMTETPTDELTNAASDSLPAPETNHAASFATLLQILKETEAEFNQLPAFTRPLARAGFKRKSGASLAEWQARLQSYAGVQPVDQAQSLAQDLDKLAAYYREVPQETARFTRDAHTLAEISARSRQRVDVIQQLVAGLKAPSR